MRRDLRDKWKLARGKRDADFGGKRFSRCRGVAVRTSKVPSGAEQHPLVGKGPGTYHTREWK